MKLQVRVRLVFRTAAATKAAYLALKPDNVGFPKGLRMTMKSHADFLELMFYSTARVGTLASTIDEVLEKIQVTEELARKVKLLK